MGVPSRSLVTKSVISMLCTLLLVSAGATMATSLRVFPDMLSSTSPVKPVAILKSETWF